ncbi:MAG TPA: tyrosine--tRNA ligase [Xanthomonadales bacterium]|nr:tyrosine--tRNA ligase [Xanthomonadales bacterium]
MDKIEELLTRGVANIIPGKKELEKALRSGKKLNIYSGFDATAPKLTLGHTVPFRKLQALADLGHNVTFLIGDFTTLIGDNSDKEAERPAITSKEIKENFKTYQAQAGKVLDFSKVQVKFNSEWLDKLSFSDVVRLCQNFSVGDFISRELVKKRLNDGKRVGLHELLYPVMQGYDHYYMDTDLQIGATEQTFNMQTGRTLQKLNRDKESFIMTLDILEGTDGRRMSKSWGNAIWLEDLAEDMYAKVMAISDDLIIQYYTLATNIPMKKITQIESSLKNGGSPMVIKKDLAFEIVKELHSSKDAESAKKNFEKTVQQKEMPTDMEVISLLGGLTASEVLVQTGLAVSRSDAKRLIEQNGVSLNDKKITDPEAIISEGILKKGRSLRKIVIKK